MALVHKKSPCWVETHLKGLGTWLQVAFVCRVALCSASRAGGIEIPDDGSGVLGSGDDVVSAVVQRQTGDDVVVTDDGRDSAVLGHRVRLQMEPLTDWSH